MSETAKVRWPGDPDWPAVLRTERPTPFEATLSLAVGPESPWLEGHFPDRPVLPGVVLLRWAIQAAERLWPGPAAVRSVVNLKFSRPVLPPAGLALHLRRHDERGRLDFRYTQEDQVCAAGRVHFA